MPLMELTLKIKMVDSLKLLEVNLSIVLRFFRVQIFLNFTLVLNETG